MSVDYLRRLWRLPRLSFHLVGSVLANWLGLACRSLLDFVCCF